MVAGIYGSKKRCVTAALFGVRDMVCCTSMSSEQQAAHAVVLAKTHPLPPVEADTAAVGPRRPDDDAVGG